jgi:hypothetical protein
MYTLIQSISLRRFFLEQLPALAISFVIAEMFYKFHSFTLECIAFLLTWFVLDGVIQLMRRFLRTNNDPTGIHKNPS